MSPRHHWSYIKVRGCGRLQTLTGSGAALCAGWLVLAVLLGGGVMWPPGLSAAVVNCSNEAIRTGASERLPDCRVYEQVSPVDKEGYSALQETEYWLPIQAAPDGESFAWLSNGDFANAAGHELLNAYVASRSAGRWQTASVTPPVPEVTDPFITSVSYFFSSDLSQVAIEDANQQLTASTVPAELATPDIRNIYLRHRDGSYSLVTAAHPANPVECGPRCEYLGSDDSDFAGANAGTNAVPAFTHVIFMVNESLATTPLIPSGPGTNNLYESDMGRSVSERVRPVGILPDGSTPAGGSEPGAGLNIYGSSFNRGGQHALANAISNDGSRVIFQASADGSAGRGRPEDPSQSGLTEIFARVDGSSTEEISAPAIGATLANGKAEPAQFWTASPNGALVDFTSRAALTTQSNTGPERAGEVNAGDDLYVYDTTTGALSDLSVDSSETNGADVLGMLGASEDGAYVYFVANGLLGDGHELGAMPGSCKASAGLGEGGCNLYISHEGVVHFIARVSEADWHDWTAVPNESQAYLTPDGKHLAFMSVEALTGFDNLDQKTGERDSEVFEYSAQSQVLACVSCDPNGSRPIGGAYIGSRAENAINARNPFNNGEVENVSTWAYQPRVLSDDGSRLFFSSPDPLVVGAGGAHSKIYEHEGGQDYLIASGAPVTDEEGRLPATSKTEDVFLDASANGNDVFFATVNQLTKSDHDELYDVEDARVDGGFPEPTPQTACSGGCQVPPSAPPAPGAPGSLLLAGSGPVLPPPPVPAVAATKPTSEANAQKLAAASKVCRKKPKGKRASCEAAARKKYGGKSKASRAKTRKAASGAHRRLTRGGVR